MPTKLDITEILKRFKTSHKNKYDYSLVEYKNINTKIEILCNNCCKTFFQTPKCHLRGDGCPECSKNKKLNNSTFIEKSNKKHNNKYDYSLVEYINNKTKIKIICPEHGVFEQTPHEHLSGHGCCMCGGSKKLSINNFIERSNKIHDNKYDYSLVEYKNNCTKVKICCPVHGIFEQIPNVHLLGSGCAKCNESKGEKQISQILNNLNIEYIREHTFKDCKYINLLEFDFYLPEFDCCVEFDGKQHFEPVFGEEELQKTKIRDEIKNNYCRINDIYLLRISYKDNLKDKMLYFEKKL